MKIKFLLFSLATAFYTMCSAQNITTIAGGGSYNVDGVPAIAVQLQAPWGVAVDASGNVYIADWLDNRVRKVDVSGTIYTIAGTTVTGFSGDGGLATTAKFDGSSKVGLDTAGNIYISDYFNNRVRKININTGIINTVAGSSNTPGFSGDSSAATSAKLFWPNGTVFDAAGNMYIADESNNRIRKVDATTGYIYTIAGDGTAGYAGDSGLATAAQLRMPNEPVIDAAGDLYFVDQANHCIRKVTMGTGIITTVAGNGNQGFSGDGGLATVATLNSPQGLAVDALGNIYIADRFNYRIRKVDKTTGIISTIAGIGTNGYTGDGGLAANAQLGTTSGLALDASGNLYIADDGNACIRKITMNTTGIEDKKIQHFISVSPNPSPGIFMIRSDEVISGVEIINMLGDLVYSSKNNSESIALDLSNEAKGTYFVRIYSKNETTVKKVVLQYNNR